MFDHLDDCVCYCEFSFKIFKINDFIDKYTHIILYFPSFFFVVVGEIKSNSHDMQMKQTETYENSKNNAFIECALIFWRTSFNEMNFN